MEQAWQVTFVNYPTNSLNICRLLRGQTRYLEIDLQAEKGISFHFFFFLFYFSNNFSE